MAFLKPTAGAKKTKEGKVVEGDWEDVSKEDVDDEWTLV